MNFLMIEKFSPTSLPWRHYRRQQRILKVAKIILLVVPLIIMAAWLLQDVLGTKFTQAAAVQDFFQQENKW